MLPAPLINTSFLIDLCEKHGFLSQANTKGLYTLATSCSNKSRRQITPCVQVGQLVAAIRCSDASQWQIASCVLENFFENLCLCNRILSQQQVTQILSALIFLQRVAATNLFCRDKDFHKNSPAHAKQFVIATCHRNVLLQLVAYCVLNLNICGPGGTGGIPDFKLQGWSNGGKNQNPKKSHADFPSHKNFQSNYTARTCGSYHESSDCFEYPKKSLIKSSHPKKYLPDFPTQKNPGKSKNLSPSLKIRINQPPPPPPTTTPHLGSW